MRYIWLIRHGESRERLRGERDHERPLNSRGSRDGIAMQNWFSAHSHPAHWIWSSNASRALMTAEFVARGFVARGFTATIKQATELYLAGPETILDVLRSTPSSVQSVALVAHNPGLTYLTNLLAAESVTDNLVTFGSALFATEVDWSGLNYHHNQFISLTTPKLITPVS